MYETDNANPGGGKPLSCELTLNLSTDRNAVELASSHWDLGISSHEATYMGDVTCYWNKD